MRVRHVLGLACLVACDAGGASPSQQAPPATSVALPPIAQSWVAPPLEQESGKCWVKLRRLTDAQLEGARREFLARNPGWEPHQVDVNQYTGAVEAGSYSRKSVGPVAELSDQLFELRRLAPLRRNADLIGLKPADLERLVWEPGQFWGSTQNAGGSVAIAHIACDKPGAEALDGKRDCWEVMVHFQRDGVVCLFTARRTAPPAELCVEASITKEQARRSRGIVDASAQPKRLGAYLPSMTATTEEIGDAKLSVAREYEGESSNWTSMTWRLVWLVNVKHDMYSFVVDANTGKTVGLRKNFVDN